MRLSEDGQVRITEDGQPRALEPGDAPAQTWDASTLTFDDTSSTLDNS